MAELLVLLVSTACDKTQDALSSYIVRSSLWYKIHMSISRYDFQLMQLVHIEQ